MKNKTTDIYEMLDTLSLPVAAQRFAELSKCILRSPADSDAFQSGRCAEHNGHPETPIIVS